MKILKWCVSFPLLSFSPPFYFSIPFAHPSYLFLLFSCILFDQYFFCLLLQFPLIDFLLFKFNKFIYKYVGRKVNILLQEIQIHWGDNFLQTRNEIWKIFVMFCVRLGDEEILNGLREVNIRRVIAHYFIPFYLVRWINTCNSIQSFQKINAMGSHSYLQTPLKEMFRDCFAL